MAQDSEIDDPQLLFMSKDSLLLRNLAASEEAQFPQQLLIDDFEYSLRYHFEPGHAEDGVSLIMPLAYCINHRGTFSTGWYLGCYVTSALL